MKGEVLWVKTSKQYPSQGQLVVAKSYVCRHPPLYDYELAIFKDGLFVSKWSGKPVARVCYWQPAGETK